MAKNLPSTEDFYRFNFVSTPDYNAQSAQVAYVSSRANKQENRYDQQILVKNLNSGETRVITAGGWAETNPRFTADGKKLLFLSNAGDSQQVWAADLISAETWRITNLEQEITSPVWSPLGDKIAFLAPAEPPEREQETIEKKPWIVTDFGYKNEDAMGFAPPKSSRHLWVIDLEDKTPRCLTDGDREHVMPCWSPDGKDILFVSSRERSKQEFLGMDLFSVNLASGEIKRLTDSFVIAYYPKPVFPRFTPDGKYIILGGIQYDGKGLPPTELYRVPAGGGEAVRIFEDEAACDGASMFLYNGDSYGGTYENMQVSSDGKYAYFISGWQGSGNIFRVNIEGEPKIEAFTQGKRYYKSIGEVQDGKMICLGGDELHPTEVWLLDEESKEETCLTQSNSWLEDVALSPMDELWVNTLDGKSRLQGWVIKPQNARSGEKYPAVLYIHGGPSPFYGYALGYEYQALAAQGIGVILVNPRGSTSYGREHSEMSQAFDGTAYTDFLQYVDEAVKHFDWIDGERLGVCGGSYGGYMTAWIAGHSKRFKAAAAHRSLANQLISYASSDMGGSSSSKSHESFVDFMIDQLKESPVTYADNINIPFLILHGMRDMRCPVEEAHQLFTAVKDQHPDLPVRMVLFPKSNHSLTMSGPMYLRIRHCDENINWFKKYL